MLIDTYSLEVFTPPCSPGSVTYTAVATLTADIAAALPYLNATLRGAVYQPGAHALTWRHGRYYVALHPHEIAASNVEDRDAARQEVESLIQLVNTTWEQRAALKPDATTYQRPTPLAVYRWLPATNCRQCGQQTCFNFALRLVAGQAVPAECPPLAEPDRAAAREALQRLLDGLAAGRVPKLGPDERTAPAP